MASKQADSDNEQDEDIQSHQFKIILLGDGAVGKTSIATRFSEEKFSQNYKQTVGVDFFMKRIHLPRKYSFAFALACIFLHNFFLCTFTPQPTTRSRAKYGTSVAR